MKEPLQVIIIHFAIISKHLKTYQVTIYMWENRDET